jgi:hypothetical protein
MKSVNAPEIDLPAIESLSPRQQRGADCVYCAVGLTPGNVVDLGWREANAHGTTVRWAPRRHRLCTAAHWRASRALLAHVYGCEGCLPGCAAGDELRAAVKAARR